MNNIEISTLGKSCEFFNGKAHEKAIDENGEFIVVNSKFISQEGEVIKRTNKQIFPLFEGDIVMVMSDVPNGKALAKCFLIDKDNAYSLNQRICAIRSVNFDKKFLLYQLNRNKHFLKFNNGENQTNLRKDDILNCPLIKPSIEQQRKIVELLDETFFSFEQAKVNVAKNLDNAKELFQSELNQIFSKSSESWSKKKLEDICERITKGSSPKWQGINYTESPGILFVTSENVGEGEILLDKPKYVEERFNDIEKKSILHKGDVLTNIVGASIGRTAIFDLDEVANINQAVCILRCLPEIINNSFLMHLLNSPFFKNILHENEVNNARANLSLGFFKSLVIPIPPLKEQIEIIERIEQLKEMTNQIFSNYQIKLNNIEELKEVIFQKVFNGELIKEVL